MRESRPARIHYGAQARWTGRTLKKTEMNSERYLAEVEAEFRKLKRLAEAAMAQVSDDGFFRTLDPDNNSIAVLVKHVAGNLRSRWRDFLTSDGEKPDRHRDDEFVIGPGETRRDMQDRWERGWALLFQTLEALSRDDLERTVTIRGTAHSVPEALNRALSHYAIHVGQIILLAKHWSGTRWQTLSIPRDRSADVNVATPRRPNRRP